jgi:putative hemolysin
MTIENYWEFFTKFFWPVVVLYAGYIHRELAMTLRKLDELNTRHYEFKTQVSKEYVTHVAAKDLENRLTDVLNRIDDKVTRILENHKHG